MREILGVAQEEPQTRRRWFHDEYFDLFVWQDAGGEITSFQLCYGIDSSERALVWRKTGGFFHDGEQGDAEDAIGARLEPGASLASDPVGARFESAARALPEEIRAVVTEHIRGYAEQKRATQIRRKRFRRAGWQQHKPETH